MASRVTAAAANVAWRPATEYVRVSGVAIYVAWKPSTPTGSGNDQEGGEQPETAQAQQPAPGAPTSTPIPASQPISAQPGAPIQGSEAGASRPGQGGARRTTGEGGGGLTRTGEQVSGSTQGPTGQRTQAAGPSAESETGASAPAVSTQAASQAPASLAAIGGIAAASGAVSPRTSSAARGAGRAGAQQGIAFSPAQIGALVQQRGALVGASTAQIMPAGANGITIRGEAMKITASFLNLDFERINPPPLRYAVESYSCNAIGGAEYATINAAGDERAIQFLASMLRYPVEIVDSAGRTVWWGYIHGVELRVRNRVARLDLSRVWNYVTVEYNALASGTDGTGTRALTAAGTDTTSITRYGRRELLQQATDISTATGAEAKRDELLNYYSLPRVERESVQRTTQATATIFCRGWFDTLSWRYYSDSDNTDVATTTQISDIVTAAGEFITSTTITDASGISTNPYRDGNDRALEVIRQLMLVGTTNGRRLLATVNQQRGLNIYEEAANSPTTNYRIDALDLLRGPTGQVVMPHTCPVGVWVTDGDGLIGPLDGASLADPGAFFIERAEYSVQAARLNMQPRGAVDVFDFVRITPG